MSTTKRLISGSLASWVRIGVTIFSQLMLVPVYLQYWDVNTYSIWLAVITITNMFTIIDKSFQDFLGFEFLRIGRNNIKQISFYLTSGAVTTLIIVVCQILVVLFILKLEFLAFFLGNHAFIDPIEIKHAGIILLCQLIAWIISGSVGGILGRALAVFGYYPRMVWWGVLGAFFTSFSPVISVTFGANLLEAGLVSAAATIVYNVPVFIDMLSLLRKERITFSNFSIKLGSSSFYRSLTLALKDLLENFRHQGIRLILVPLSGLAALAAFSTMRTGANAALQGLNTLTNPLMPELMRFLHDRDQKRVETAFATIWIVLVFLMAPAVVVLQLVAEPLFEV